MLTPGNFPDKALQFSWQAFPQVVGHFFLTKAEREQLTQGYPADFVPNIELELKTSGFLFT